MSPAVDVPEGYKLTEVGVIPGDWGVRPFGDLTSTVASGRSKVNAAFGNYSVHGSTGVIGFSDVADYEGDAILVARVGANAGKLNVVSGKYGVTDNTIMLRLRNDSFLSFFWRQLEGMRLNRLVFGSGQPLITGSQLKALSVSVPPLPEQRAIATALSDVDALLAKLDQLIAKKQGLKQAAMQQLLTGQTRLPGFSGEWDLRPLASVVSGLEAGVSVNSVDHMDPHSSTNPCILKTSAVFDGNFDPTECKLIDRRDLSRAKLSPRKDSIIISRMNTPNLVGEVGYVAEDFPNLNLPDRLWITRFGSGADVSARWLAYVMSSTQVKEVIKGLATGTSGSMKNIAKGALLSLQLTFPSYAEQTAIATLLSDMDAELAALEARQGKTRALKQGMMQALLTGRIRLV